MKRWTKAELDEHINRRKYADDSAQLPDAEPEQSPRAEPLDTDQGEGPRKARIVVRYLSLRTSLLDEDNLAGGTKYITDALRAGKLIPGDDPRSVKIEWEQQKVPHKDQEETVVTITYPQHP